MPENTRLSSSIDQIELGFGTRSDTEIDNEARYSALSCWSISGIVDLVHIRPDTVEIIGFKTDVGQHAEDEYQKQISVNYHVLNER